MMKTLLASLALVSLATFAEAQTTIAVDIAKAKFVWTWAQGTGGAVAQFHVKCGTATGSYTTDTIVNDPAARQLPISSAITAPGTYFCVVAAANQFGQSANSNQVSFAAGAVPVAPASLTIQAQ